jgi:hypothetical protein
VHATCMYLRTKRQVTRCTCDDSDDDNGDDDNDNNKPIFLLLER